MSTFSTNFPDLDAGSPASGALSTLQDTASGRPDLAPQDWFAQMVASPSLAEWAREVLSQIEQRHGRDLLRAGFRSGNHAEPSIPRYLRSGEPYAAWLAGFLSREDISLDAQRAWLEHGFLADDPKWLTELLERDRAQIARLFLLSGNISDYAFDPVLGYRPGIRLLVDTLRRHKEFVLTLSLSRGWSLESQDQQIRQTLKDRGFPLDRIGRFDLKQPLAVQICECFDELRRWLEKPDNQSQGIAIVVENVHLIIPPSGASTERNFLIDSLLSWSVSPTLFHSPHCLILMADFLEDVSDELGVRGGKIDNIAVERPSSTESRLKFLLPLLQPQASMVETRVARLSQGLDLQNYGDSDGQQLLRIAQDIAGLTLIGIEDIVQQAAFDPRHALDRKQVMQAKRERLRQESEGLLEVIDPSRTLGDFAGYPELKCRLQEIIHAINNQADSLWRSTIPMGILFVGPPGTGKTWAAEAIAGSSQINIAKMGDFRGMYVGQSERNLSRLLSLIEALHPVIVFMDELDQSEGTRGETGDSGVSKRIFGKLLQFMSDTSHRGKILWIGATNRPDKLDPAMKRVGRFDLVLPFLLPDGPSREEILRMQLARKLDRIEGITVTLSAEDYGALAERTVGFSGAEIEGLVAELLRRAARQRVQTDNVVEINRGSFETVLDVYAPQQVRNDYRDMEDLALMEVRYSDLLPQEYQKRHRELLSANRGTTGLG
ncbi:MAG: ATP-binding protein [Chloroflexi bacterium]|nr:ATP-binding protein [Chloroflexota bacterium]